MFSCEFCKNYKQSIFNEDLRLLLLDVLNSIYFNALHILIVILKIKTRNGGTLRKSQEI